MSGQKKKATKKFEQKHLKDTIDRRKDFAKVKHRHQVKAKKKARQDAKTASISQRADGNSAVFDKPTRTADSKNDLGKMSIDEFFQSSFDLPISKTTKKPAGKRKREEAPQELDREDDASSSSAAEFGFDSGDEEEEEAITRSSGKESHGADLKELAKNDPDFYKYLEQNDAELLEFEDDAELPSPEEVSTEDRPKKKPRTIQRQESESGDEDSDGEVDGMRQEDDRSEVTMAMIERWGASISEQHSLNAMRQVVTAFKAATHINSEEHQTYKYSIPNAEIYHALLVLTLEGVPKVLHHHLPPKELASGKVKIATDGKMFRGLVPIVKSYTMSLHRLLDSLSDASTIKLTLNSLEPLLPYMLSFNKFLKQVLMTVISIWSSTMSTASDTTLLTAFIVIRRLFVLGESSLRSTILKLVYAQLIKTARITNSHTIPTINLLKNTALELYSLDFSLGYVSAFSSIRQLAVHLRTTITHPTKESHKQIYNWQYLHSLDFWSRTLCHSCTLPQFHTPTASPLHPLIYPLVQITLGSLRLIPSSTYFPLHLHLIRSLLRISLNTKAYIPLAPHLLSILSHPEISKPPNKPSSLAPLPFPTTIRAPKPYLRTRQYQDGIASQIQLLLGEFFTCWSTNIAFPELVVPPTVMLKRWLKSLSKTTTTTTVGTVTGHKGPNDKNKNRKRPNKNPKILGLFTQLLQKVAQQAAVVEEARATVTFAPRDRAEVEGFMRDVDVRSTVLGVWMEGVRAREGEGVGTTVSTAGAGAIGAAGGGDGPTRKEGADVRKESRGGPRGGKAAVVEEVHEEDGHDGIEDEDEDEEGDEDEDEDVEEEGISSEEVDEDD